MSKKEKLDLFDIKFQVETKVILNLVMRFFNDPYKAELWFDTPNPSLGTLTPRQMLLRDRFKKLHKFVKNCLEENFP